MAKVEFKDPPPKRRGHRGYWEDTLAPLVSHPGRWAKVETETSIAKAQYTAGNLNTRKVAIPHPDHDWAFLSRGREVFAIYRGKKVRRGKSVRRTQRKG